MDLELLKFTTFVIMTITVTYFSFKLKTEKELRDEQLKQRREESKITKIKKI